MSNLDELLLEYRKSLDTVRSSSYSNTSTTNTANTEFVSDSISPETISQYFKNYNSNISLYLKSLEDDLLSKVTLINKIKTEIVTLEELHQIKITIDTLKKLMNLLQEKRMNIMMSNHH